MATRQGQQLAGRGGERLTQALISSATPESGTDLQAIALSDPEVPALLKKVAPENTFRTGQRMPE
ncbi:hypothetical protein [Mycobacteroides abscessus]|uniref:hypothetical protein n=1 Tax=Mycobacteroides abscessus TaxID=36809 RepID=UPI0010427FD1|nr:hypothetical protein [Mycobacteroides abscessus]